MHRPALLALLALLVRPRVRARACAALACAAALALAIAMHPAGNATAASSSVTITANVVGSTSIDLTGCATASAIDFGALQPGASTTTTSDCTIGFGSANSVASLAVAQADGFGRAMWRPAKGVLDTGFAGGAGYINQEVGGQDLVNDTALRPDGATYVLFDKSSGANNTRLQLGRFTAAGALDTSWGTGGYVSTPLWEQGGAPHDGLAGVRVLADNSIVVAGGIGATRRSAIVKFTPAGALDTGFGGGDGIVDWDSSGINAQSMAYGVTLLADGDLLATGWSEVSGGLNDSALARVNPDGTMDTTFGGGDGILSYHLNSIEQGFISALELDDGRIIAAGGGYTASGSYALVRFGATGVVDTTFGTAGVAYQSSLPNFGALVDVQPGPGGTLLALAFNASTNVVYLTRSLANGGLDATFGTGGVVTVGVSVQRASHRGFLVQPDGKVLVGGSTAVTGGDARVRRYLPNGALDTTFATGGTFTAPAVPGGEDSAFVTAGPDGVVRLVGHGYDTQLDFFLAQLAAGGTPIDDYDDAGNKDWSTVGASLFGACLRTSGSATNDWVPNASCTVADGTHWRGVTPAGSTIAHTTVVGTTSGSASLRFGLRTPASAAPGALVAPLRFTVTAP